LGYLNDEELVELCRITKEISSRNEIFDVNLKKIVYGPDEKKAKMIWVEAEKNKELESLQKELDDNLPLEKEKENRKYSPHITLGRLKLWEFNKLELEERPQVQEEISLSFPVKSIEIMESDLKRGGPEYQIVESFDLME
jgi:2'-5' RNA ligase